MPNGINDINNIDNKGLFYSLKTTIENHKNCKNGIQGVSK